MLPVEYGDLAGPAIAGDRAKLEALLELVWPEAYRIAKGVAGNKSSAEDAAQEACAIIYRRIGTLRNAAAFKSWFYRIVVRCTIAASSSESVILPGLTDATTAIVETHADSIDLNRALDSLPANLRAPIILRYYAGLSSREIGVVIGIPSATVRFRLSQAKSCLQKILVDPRTNSPRIHEELEQC